MILAGDIGGTKSLFGLFDGAHCHAQRCSTNADFTGFDDVVADFLAAHAGVPIERACFALAGPVPAGGRQARLTNLPWALDAAALEQRHGLPVVHLINDFVAAALGAVATPTEQRVLLQAGLAQAAAPALVIGAGTGLGMAVALPREQRWQVLAGEGGHAGFAPADEAQLALWQFLRARHSRVTWERVVSGPGLAAIHEFLGGGVCEPAAIAAAALADGASLAGRSLAMFLAAYGAFAGDMALALQARGGVFLAGGIAAKVLPALRGASGPFLTAFHSKAEHAGLMPDFPVQVITDPAVGLRGAARWLPNDC